MVASFRFLVEDVMLRRVIGSVPMTGASYEEFKRRPGVFRAKVSMADANRNIDLLVPDTRAVYVERNRKIEWGGLLEATPVALGAEEVDVACSGWGAWFDRRDLWNDLTFTQVDQFSIFAALVADVQDEAVVDSGGHLIYGPGANLGIGVVWDSLSGVLRDRKEEYRFFAGKNLGTALRQLAALENGFDYAMEYSIVGDAIVKNVRLFYPRQGADHSTEKGFTYTKGRKSNVMRRGKTNDASGMKWRYRGWGSGADVSRMHVESVRDDLRGVYPFFDGQLQQQSVGDPATLQGNTNAARATTDHPTVLPLTEVDPEMDPKWGTYGLGDRWAVTIDDGFASTSGTHELVGYHYDVDTDRPVLYWQAEG